MTDLESHRNEESNEEQGKRKFISLMTSLLQHIEQNNSHQQTIYQCLNSEEINQLFQSIHDHDRNLRMIATQFIARLLYNSRTIVDSFMLRQNTEMSTTGKGQHQKIIITGLKQYDHRKLRDYVLAINSIKYKKHCLYWYVNAKNCEKGYKLMGDEDQPIDPIDNIIGIFVGNQGHNSHGSQNAKQLKKENTKGRITQTIKCKECNKVDVTSPEVSKVQHRNAMKTVRSFQAGRFSIGSQKNSRKMGYSSPNSSSSVVTKR